MSSTGLRVLVDATAVPADRGGVGRYVDGLVEALGAAGADLAVACQRSDAERFGNWVPTTMGPRYDALLSFDETQALHPLHLEPPWLQAELETYPWGR